MSIQTFPELLAQQAQQLPEHIAILDVEGNSLTYKRLYAHVQETVGTLRELGVGYGQRVGLIVAQGPVMATAILSVVNCAIAVPFNHQLKADEYRVYLQAANVNHIIIQNDLHPEVRTIAADLGIAVIELTVCQGPECGIFALSGQRASAEQLASLNTSTPRPDDIAMVMLSSGTTSRPKVVPREHLHLINSMILTNAIWKVTPEDRLLNVFPLYFTGGLSEFLRTVVFGASIVITTGFDITKFYDWLDRFQPTMFSATANVFRAILAYVPAHQAVIQRHQLRYLRTGSMAMPSDLLLEVERVFGVFMMQQYGSTEVGSIALTPLPPAPRKLDSVGVAIGGEVAIFDDNNRQLPPMQIGEIRVRDYPMFRGYENAPDLNAASFVEGWFRTGDQGYLDGDNYLFVTGRIKELISRGGEKISPQEVEAVLATCPGIAEAAVFPVADKYVGEEVGAAIVRTLAANDEAAITATEIRQFVAARLATSKIPRHIFFVDQLPKTPQGKVKRLALTENLVVPPSNSSSSFTAPRTELELKLANVWADILHCSQEVVGINTHFRDLGGDSLASARLIFKVREVFNVMVTIVDFFDKSTVAEQAQVIQKLLTEPEKQRILSTLIPIRPGGTRYPLYCLHALDGGVYFYQPLVPLLHPEQPIYGLQGVGMDGNETPLDCAEDVAVRQAQEIRAVQLRGPYFLCGYSAGGRLALETARILQDKYGEKVFVFIIDDHIGVNDAEVRRQQQIEHAAFIPRMQLRLDSLAYVIGHLPMRYKLRYLREKLTRFDNSKTRREQRISNARDIENREAMMPPEILKVQEGLKRAVKSYRVRPYSGPLTYLLATGDSVNIPFFRTWDTLTQGNGEIIEVPGVHSKLMKPPYINTVANHLQAWLDRVQTGR